MAECGTIVPSFQKPFSPTHAGQWKNGYKEVHDQYNEFCKATVFG